MKITILTLGSRGDVQPYVALGKELINRGHKVTICTGQTFKEFIINNGVDFYKASIDFMEILKTEEGQAIFNGGGNIFKTMSYAKKEIYPLFRRSFDDFLEASKESDLIIYHPKALVATDVAEYLNIPCVSMPPVPMIYPISEFPSLAVSPKRNLGKTLNKLTYTSSKYGESANMKDINEFREVVLGLSKRKTGELYESVNGVRTPIVYPVSRYLFEDVKSWEGKVELPGFFYLDLGNQMLSEEIKGFLEKGQAPIVISFSSMPMKHAEVFKEKLLTALEETNNRAIVLTGISGLDFEGNENVLAVPKAPHRLLFREAKGIIHHGGVGTMAEALLSGKPQVIMPFNVDQPFWAHRLYKLEYALEPLSEKTVSSKILVDRFQDFDNAGLISKAEEIAKKIQNENGISNAADYIESRYQNA